MRKATLSIIVFMVCLFLVFNAGFARDASGSAIMPHYIALWTSSSDFNNVQIHMSNITDATITVKLIVYNKDGIVLTDASTDAAAGTFYLEQHLNIIPGNGN